MRKTICLAVVALTALVPANFAAAQSAADKAMAQQIGRGLKDSGQLHDYRIGVKYQQGVAWLSGSVANEQQLTTAMQLTQEMPNVQRVVNNLSLAGAPPASQNNRSLELGQPLRQASAQTAGQTPRRVNHAYTPPQGMPPGRMARMPQPPGNRPIPTRPMPGQMPNQAMHNRPNGPMQAGCNCQGGMMGGPASGGYGGDMSGGYGGAMMGPGPMAMGNVPGAYGGAVSSDNAAMPGYAWPSYASYPNYAALSYPRQYSPTAWPYIGPFYPYPQVPLGWRKVALEWDDGWWFLDFSDCGSNH